MGAAASPVSGQSLERAEVAGYWWASWQTLVVDAASKQIAAGVATNGLEACTVLSTLIRMLS